MHWRVDAVDTHKIVATGLHAVVDSTAVSGDQALHLNSSSNPPNYNININFENIKITHFSFILTELSEL